MKRKATIFIFIFLSCLFLLSNVYAGTPKITSCVNEIELKPGFSDVGYLVVKNIGDISGYFDLKINCNKEEVSAIGYAGFFKAEEEQTLNIAISGTNPNEDSSLVAICTYIITDRNEQESDSCISPVIIKGYGVNDKESLNDEEIIPTENNIDNSSFIAIPLIIGVAIIIGFIILAVILRSRK